jgi:hypothetical protein
MAAVARTIAGSLFTASLPLAREGAPGDGLYVIFKLNKKGTAVCHDLLGKAAL